MTGPAQSVVRCIVSSEFQGVGEHPEIPGTIAQCEWCGYFVYTYTSTKLHYCPNCKNGTLRSDCPHCSAPIAYPPQPVCLACGKNFTILKMQEVPGGMGSVTIIEPDAKRRAELEVKGNHWHDVVRGTAEGPDLPSLNAAPPPGWTREDFDKRLRGAKVDAGEDLTQPAPPRAEVAPNGQVLVPSPETLSLIEALLKMPTQFCEKCEITFVVQSPEDELGNCPRCGSILQPPTEPPGLDKPDAAG